MCRHLAWLGRPRTLAELMVDGPHSLLVQSYAPREQRYGTVNADGFGVAWYSSARPEPARYRRAQPIWTDASFASMAGVVSSGCVLAAVRSATSGTPVEETATPPFTAGRWSFSHNGALADPVGSLAGLRTRLPAAAAAAVESSVDSALLWALLRHRLNSGEPPAVAMAGVIADVTEVTTGRLNLLATDGEQVVATRWGDTLYLRVDADGVLVASEPGALPAAVPHGADADPAAGEWRPVPEGSLLVVSGREVSITPLPSGPAGQPIPTTPQPLDQGAHR